MANSLVRPTKEKLLGPCIIVYSDPVKLCAGLHCFRYSEVAEVLTNPSLGLAFTCQRLCRNVLENMVGPLSWCLVLLISAWPHLFHLSA